MRPIVSEACLFELFEREGRLLLAVECGTTAVFTLTLALTNEEEAAFRADGVASVRQLALAVRTRPVRYGERGVEA